MFGLIKVLLVTGDEKAKKDLTHLILSSGYDVRSCDSGEKAIELFHGDSYPFVIVDQELDRNGYIVEAMGRNPNQFKTIFVALTAHNSTPDPEKLLAAGFDDWLSRPLERGQWEINVRRLERWTGLFSRYLEDQKKLDAYSKRINRILDRMVEHTAILDGEGKMEYISPHFAEYLGQAREDLISASIFYYIHPEDFIEFNNFFMEVLFSPNSKKEYEVRFSESLHAEERVRVQLENCLSERELEGMILHFYPTLNSEDVCETEGAASSRETVSLDQEKLHKLDDLNGFVGKSRLKEEISSAAEQLGELPQDHVVLILVEFKNSELWEEQYDHLTIKQLIPALAKRLEACKRPDDIIARTSDYQYCLLLRHFAHVNTLPRIKERVEELLKRSFYLEGATIDLDPLVGISASNDRDISPDDLLNEAIQAIYVPNRLKAERVEGEMHHDVEEENRLYMGLKENRFRLFYQPIISLNTGKISGMEALIRWEHPEKGLLVTREFLSMAEHTDLIVPLGEWVLKEALIQLRKWRTLEVSPDDFSIHVNVSEAQYLQGDLIYSLNQLQKQEIYTNNGLALEIKETFLIEHPEKAAGMLKKLNQLDVAIVVDWFADGFSSLSCLDRYEIDMVKFPAGWLRSEAGIQQSLKMETSLLNATRKRDVRVVVEGIETLEDYRNVKSTGYPLGQGYYFAFPMPASVATNLLKNDVTW